MCWPASAFATRETNREKHLVFLAFLVHPPANQKDPTRRGSFARTVFEVLGTPCGILCPTSRIDELAQGNDIGADGAAELGKSLSHCELLQTLRLGDNPLQVLSQSCAHVCMYRDTVPCIACELF